MNIQWFQILCLHFRTTVVVALCFLMSITCAVASTQVDVSNQVMINRSGLVYNRVSDTFDSTATLTNTLIPIVGPIRVIFAIDPATVELANASGKTNTGLFYIDVPIPNGTLAPGGSLTSLLKFKNPHHVSFNIKTHVLASINTGSDQNSVTQAIDSQGGIVELADIATLTIPPGTFETLTAVHIEKINRPEAELLLNEIVVGAQLLPLPQLKIKLSTNLLQPMLLEMPLRDGDNVIVINEDDQIEFIKLVTEFGDNQEAMDGIQTLGGKLCGENKKSLCVTLYPSQFDPVPTDPLDPIINISVAKLPFSKVKDLFFKEVTDAKPDANVQNDATHTVFSAKIKVAKTFFFGPTGGAVKRPTFYISRKDPPGPHLAVDLFAGTGNHVTSATAGTVIEPGPGYQSAFGTMPCGSKVISRGGGFRMWVGMGDTGLQTGYMHLAGNSNQKKLKDNVGQGDYIANSDSTGTCAPHLHVQTWVWSREGLFALDPSPLIQNDLALFFNNLEPTDLPITAIMRLGIEVNGKPYLGFDQKKPVNNMPKQLLMNNPGGRGVEITFASDPVDVAGLFAALAPKPTDKVQMVLNLLAPRAGNKDIKLAAWSIVSPPQTWQVTAVDKSGAPDCSGSETDNYVLTPTADPKKFDLVVDGKKYVVNVPGTTPFSVGYPEDTGHTTESGSVTITIANDGNSLSDYELSGSSSFSYSQSSPEPFSCSGTTKYTGKRIQ
jgi:murein DD-endopeptidase MepM/ murein hydrolase activator NlpD